ncbi:MAG: PRC-barrel domain-containing protein [Anaerobacillus sp.]
MIKVGKAILGSKLKNKSSAELIVKQVYFDQMLQKITFLEIDKKEASNEKDAVPDHHASEMLHSIQASGGQFTPDNYPVTDDDRKEQKTNGYMIVPFHYLTWEEDSLLIQEDVEEVQSSILRDQCSYNSLNKAEVLTEEGEELGKVKEVMINSSGQVEGLELSEGLLSNLLSDDQPFIHVDESVKFRHDKVIVPTNYQQN